MVARVLRLTLVPLPPCKPCLVRMKSPTEKAQAHMNALLKQMAQVLHNQPDVVEKKERYMELGFRCVETVHSCSASCLELAFTKKTHRHAICAGVIGLSSNLHPGTRSSAP